MEGIHWQCDLGTVAALNLGIGVSPPGRMIEPSPLGVVRAEQVWSQRYTAVRGAVSVPKPPEVRAQNPRTGRRKTTLLIRIHIYSQLSVICCQIVPIPGKCYCQDFLMKSS